MKTILWFSFFLCCLPHTALAQPWQASQDRSGKIEARYRALVMKSPQEGVFLNQWVKTLGKKGVVRTISQFKAEKNLNESETIALSLLLKSVGSHTEARAVIDRLINRKDSMLARSARASVLLELGEIDLAIVDLKKTISVASNGKRKKAIRRTIDTLLRADRGVEALSFFDELLKAEPNNKALRREFVDVLIRDGQFERALSTYDDLIRLAGKNGKLKAGFLRDRGDLHAKTNRYQEALGDYNSARRLASSRSWFRHEIDHRLVQLHRSAGTLRSFYPVIKKRWGKTRKQWVPLASIAQEVGVPEDAKKWLIRAWKNDRRTIQAADMLIKIHESDGELDRAHTVYKQLVESRSKDASTRAEYANWLYYTMRDSDGARNELKKTRKLATFPEGEIAAAETLLRWGVHSEALSILEAVEKVAPNDPVHIEVYGTLLKKVDRPKRALEVWSRLKTDLMGTIRFAELCATHEFQPEAIGAFEVVAKKQPKNLQVLRALAELYEKTAVYDKATQAWIDVYETSRDTKAIAKLVFLARYDKRASSRYQTKFSKAPHWGLVHAWNQIDSGESAAGISTLKTTIAKLLASGDRRDRLSASHAARMVAQTYGKQGRLDLSAIWWERLARNFPTQRASAYQNAVRASARLPVAKATPVLERAAKVVPHSAAVHAERAFRAAERKDFENAITHIQKAIERRPAESDFRFELAHYLMQLGYIDKARETYVDIVAWDRSGQDAIDAAFSAIDLCEHPDDVESVEAKFRGLEHRIPKASFLTIMLDVYNFVYFTLEDKPLQEKLATHASRILAQTLGSKFADERGHALELLSLFDDESVWRVILKAATDEQNELSLAILARSRYKRAAPLFDKAAKSSDPKLKRIGWYGMAMTGSKRGLEIFSSAALSGSREERIVATWALGEYSNSYSALMTAWQAESDRHIKEVILWSLTRIGRTELVEAEFKSKDIERARVAAALLGSVSSGEARTALFNALWTGNSAIRRVVKRTLSQDYDEIETEIWRRSEFSRYGDTPDIALTVLDSVNLLLDFDDRRDGLAWNYERHQKAVVRAAQKHLPKRPELVLGDLIEIAQSEFEKPKGIEHHRLSVKKVMTQLRPELKKIAMADGEQRYTACAAIPFAGNVGDIEFLFTQLGDAKANSEVEKVLATFAHFPKKAVVPVLKKILAKNEKEMQLGAMIAVSYLDGLPVEERKEFARLIEGYVDDSGPIQTTAINALGALGEERSLPVLAKAFQSGTVTQRRAILENLRRFNSKSARKLHRKLSIIGATPPCSDGKELPELLAGRCDKLFEIDDSN